MSQDQEIHFYFFFIIVIGLSLSYCNLTYFVLYGRESVQVTKGQDYLKSLGSRYCVTRFKHLFELTQIEGSGGHLVRSD